MDFVHHKPPPPPPPPSPSQVTAATTTTTSSTVVVAATATSSKLPPPLPPPPPSSLDPTWQVGDKLAPRLGSERLRPRLRVRAAACGGDRGAALLARLAGTWSSILVRRPCGRTSQSRESFHTSHTWPFRTRGHFFAPSVLDRFESQSHRNSHMWPVHNSNNCMRKCH